MSDLLRECPFCGSYDVKLNSTTPQQTFKAEVCCENPACYAFGPKKNTNAEAIAAWNRRPTSEREARLVEALQRVKHSLADGRGYADPDDDNVTGWLPDSFEAIGQAEQALAAYQAGTRTVTAKEGEPMTFEGPPHPAQTCRQEEAEV